LKSYQLLHNCTKNWKGLQHLNDLRYLLFLFDAGFTFR